MSQTIDDATTEAAWSEEQAAGTAPPPWWLVMASGLYETPRRIPPISPPLASVSTP